MRNSVLVTHGSFRDNCNCDTIPHLSNYSTKYFLHSSDDKFKTIHDILMEHIQYHYPEDISVTFTCRKNLPTLAKHKITLIMQYTTPAKLACYMVYAISWASKDNTKTLPSSPKVLHSSII